MQVDSGIGLPDIISRVRYEGVARNTQHVKTTIVVPAPISQAVYGELVAEVKVFSKVKPGYHFRGIFNIKPLSQRQARVKVGILAGALAERVMEIVPAESVNATDYANEAMHAWDNALARFEAQHHTPLPRDASLDAILKALDMIQRLS